MVDDDLQRLRSWELTSWLYVPTVRSHRWAGAIECGARSRAVLDQWVQLWAEAGKAAADDDDSVVSGGGGEAAGGGQGAWAIKNFHADVMKPCLQQLVELDDAGTTLVTRSSPTLEKRSFPYPREDHSYYAQLCLTIEAAAEPTMLPTCRFGPAKRERGVSMGCE